MARLRTLRRWRHSIWANARNETHERLNASAVIFAPHQDDETLGCGGTIILKRAAGTPVTCVFMTDGTTSHCRFMKKEDLRCLRKQEALEATTVLGLAENQVQFLGFPDGQLGRHHDDAMLEVTCILERHRPAEVFVPYESDGTPDHEATYRIVVEAIRRAGMAIRVLEYPIWFWNQWPWVSVKLACNRTTLKAIQRILRTGFGFGLFKEFRSGVFVGSVLERKRQALAQHRSQMTRLKPGVDWPTLRDVSDGEFLNCFFQEYEVFHCCNHLPAGDAAQAKESGRDSRTAMQRVSALPQAGQLFWSQGVVSRP